MSAPKPDRLSGIRAKIERAKKHIRDFGNLELSFKQKDPYFLSTDNDPQSGEQILRIRVRHGPPTDFALLAGEAIYQLRSSLEHLAWQLAGKKAGADTGFPIYKSAAIYKAKSGAKVQGMSTDAVSRIDSFHPYQGGNDDLWALHYLNNIDKHQLLFVIAYGVSDADFTFSIGPEGKKAPLIPIISAPTTARQSNRFPIVEDGAVIGTIGGDSRHKMEMHLKVSFEVSFGEPKIVEGKAVLPFLHQLSNLVEGIVDQFVDLL